MEKENQKKYENDIKEEFSFDFYNKLKEILNDYDKEVSDYENIQEKQERETHDEKVNESANIKLNEIISITLKKIIFAVCCELSSYFMDNVFLMSKLKFQNFRDDKSFEKVLEDILYQIVKQINFFSFRAIINVFETLQLGNFNIESMVFFIKLLLTFYFVHTRCIIKLPDNLTKIQYEIIFKQNFKRGFSDMKSLIKLIPMIEFINDEDDNLIPIILRIDDIPNSIQERPSSNVSTSSLPPVKTMKNKNCKIDNKSDLKQSINSDSKIEDFKINIPSPFEDNNGGSNQSFTDVFFSTELHKK